jgi:hypothetical protein
VRACACVRARVCCVHECACGANCVHKCAGGGLSLRVCVHMHACALIRRVCVCCVCVCVCVCACVYKPRQPSAREGRGEIGDLRNARQVVPPYDVLHVGRRHRDSLSRRRETDLRLIQKVHTYCTRHTKRNPFCRCPGHPGAVLRRSAARDVCVRRHGSRPCGELRARISGLRLLPTHPERQPRVGDERVCASAMGGVSALPPTFSHTPRCLLSHYALGRSCPTIIP